MKKILILLSLTLLFLLPFYLFYRLKVNDLLIQSEDTLPAMFLPITILKEGSIGLNSYYQMLVQRYPHPDDKKQLLGLTPFYLKKVDGQYLSAFPILPALIVVPVYVLPVLFNVEMTWENVAFLSRLSSALLMACSVYLFYNLSRRFLDPKRSVLSAACFGFGTVNFASISQALWQHGVLELFVVLGLWFITSTSLSRKYLFLAGLMFGFGAIARPTGALPLVAIFVFLLTKVSRKALLSYIVGGAIPVAFFIWYNLFFYHSFSNNGYAGQLFDSWRTPIWLGLSGIFLSPSKGLLIYSPWVIFTFLWFTKLIKTHKRSFLDDLSLVSVLIVLTHLVIISMWKHWYGGWAFGYRMASDVLPFISFGLIPFLKSEVYVKYRKIFMALVVWSVGIELMGLAFFDGIWHAAYDRGYKDQAWLWSLQNSEVVFNLKRVLVKIGVLQPFI